MIDVRLIGENKFKLLAPISFEHGMFRVTVYDGFIFDGASIPQALWSIAGCPFGGLYTFAACIHDALYATRLLDRKRSDKFFYYAMLEYGVDKVKAKEMYIAVRAFGESIYNAQKSLADSREFVKVEFI